VDGWIVHDFLKDNPSAAEKEATETGKSQGGKRGNHERWHEKRGLIAPGCDFCEAAAAPREAVTGTPEKRTSHNRSHTDRISDSHATPIDRSDLDPSIPRKSKSKSKSARGRGPAPGSQEFRLKVIAKFAAVTRVDIGHETADAIAADVLGGRDHVDNPLLYVLSAIENDPAPVSRWVPRREPPVLTLEPDPDWCGTCYRADDRNLYDDQGRLKGPCPACNPKSAPLWERPAPARKAIA
jgi:hypothetical protein